MGVPFDHIAQQYDSAFTRSRIGQLQRKHVWSYLEKITPELSGLEILELNCGTGEDAMMFGEKGFNIIATDVSEEMLKITQQKIQQYSLQSRITSHYLDLDTFDETSFSKKFNLVFSNFGGLNCIDPEAMKKLLRKLPSILAPGGRFVAIIMSRSCLWEMMYFLLKFQFTNIFRRSTRSYVIANLNGANVKTWYYSPAQIKRWSAHTFQYITSRPIGIALPPSYLENFFRRRSRWLNFLNRIETRLSGFSFLAPLADHYIIDLRVT